mgnify:CR=1
MYINQATLRPYLDAGLITEQREMLHKAIEPSGSETFRREDGEGNTISA